MELTISKRLFKLNADTLLADPDPTMTPDEVKSFYQDAYPDTMNSVVAYTGLDGDGNKIYEIKQKLGQNG